MICDELKPLVFSLKDFAYIDEPAAEKNFENPHNHAVYKATEVDAAIAELKEKLESVQASMYCDVVDANMENRRLRRALFKAIANWAKVTKIWDGSRPADDFDKWFKVELKCLKKAEEYK